MIVGSRHGRDRAEPHRCALVVDAAPTRPSTSPAPRARAGLSDGTRTGPPRRAVRRAPARAAPAASLRRSSPRRRSVARRHGPRSRSLTPTRDVRPARRRAATCASRRGRGSSDRSPRAGARAVAACRTRAEAASRASPTSTALRLAFRDEGVDTTIATGRGHRDVRIVRTGTLAARGVVRDGDRHVLVGVDDETAAVDRGVDGRRAAGVTMCEQRLDRRRPQMHLFLPLLPPRPPTARPRHDTRARRQHGDAEARHPPTSRHPHPPPSPARRSPGSLTQRSGAGCSEIH